MSVIINASTTSGLTQTADNSGTLELQSNGTTKLTVSSTGAYGQLVSGTAVASTSGTSIDFTGLPSWVKRITVMLNGVSTSSTSALLIQVGSSSVSTSGYTSVSQNVSTGTSSSAGFLLNGSSAAAQTYTSVIPICLVSSNTWITSGVLGIGSTATNITTFSGSSPALGGSLDRVRITTVNGTDTFDAGSINILYEG
jgi:hypothetical protein